jgi:hypothetical protein
MTGLLKLEFVASYAGTARCGTAHVTGVRVLDPLYAGERHHIPLVEGGERSQNTDASSHAAADPTIAKALFALATLRQL